MGKQYQTRDAEASTLGLTIPDEVSVALAEIAESAKEGLLALAVDAELQVLGTMMEESVVALAGPKGKHRPDRTAVRHGHEHGSVTLGGRGTRPRRSWPPLGCRPPTHGSLATSPVFEVADGHPPPSAEEACPGDRRDLLGGLPHEYERAA